MRRGVSRLLSAVLPAVLAIGLLPALALAVPDAATDDVVAIEVPAKVVNAPGVDEAAETVVLYPSSTITPMELGEVYSVEVSSDEDSPVFEFTAPEAGLYEFASSVAGDDDPLAVMYADPDLEIQIGRDDDSGEGYDFLILSSLDEGQTVYLVAGSYSSHAVYSLSVTKSPASIYNLAMYEADADWEIDIMAGVPETFVYSVGLPGRELVEGVDYEVEGYYDDLGNLLEGFPEEPGCYYIVFRGLAPFEGRLDLIFDAMDPKDLSLAEITFFGEENLVKVEYTGMPVELGECVVSYEGDILEAGLHYQPVFYDDYMDLCPGVPSEPGEYCVRFEAVEGSGYTGSTVGEWFMIVDPYDFAFASYSLDGYSFLYNGKAIEPGAVVWDGNDKRLVEGIDYTLSYVNNIGNTETETTATAIITPKGAYRGDPIEEEFTIFPYVDLAELVNEDEWYLIEWEDMANVAGVPFLVEGRPITPDVILADNQYDLVEGADYTLSYADESGASVTPQEPGDYYIVVKGIEGGRCRGQGSIPFTIIATYDLSADNIIFAPYNDYTFNDDDVMVISGISDLADVAWEASNWKAWSDSSVVQGYDFDVSYAPGDEEGSWIATFTGKGRYSGTATKLFFIAEKMQHMLEDHSWYLDGKYVSHWAEDAEDRAKVFFDGEGNLIEPLVTSWAVNGLDFEVLGLRYDDNSPIVDPESGDLAYISIQGIGDYAGQSLKIPVVLVPEGTAVLGEIDIREDCDYEVDALYGWDSDGDGYYAWLKSEPSNPAPYLYDWVNDVELVEGEHYTAAYERAGGLMTVTLSAIEGSGYTGSVVIDVRLVDKYNIAHTMDFDYLESYHFPKGDSVEPVWGFYGDLDLTEGVDYQAIVTNSKGAEVEKLTGTDTYTLKIVGMGMWTGVIEVSLASTEHGEGEMSLAYASPDYNGVNTIAYEGKPITFKSGFGLEYGGRELVEGVDFTYSYVNNNEVGVGYILATAVEGSAYCGSCVVPFNIVSAYSMNDLDVLFFDKAANRYYYYHEDMPPTYKLGLDGVCEPQVGMGYSWRDPIESEYYDVTFGNNTAEGIAWVKLTGKGLYRGELKANFIIDGVEEADPIWTTFPDVAREVNKAGGPEKVWYVADGWLDYVVNAGLMGGYASNGYFGPYDNITRGQVAVILFRSECAENPGLVEEFGSTTDPAKYAQTVEFKDEKPNEYYTAAINWAKAVGIMTGDAGTNYTTVRPNDLVARQELCLMLARYANGGTVPSTELDPVKAQGIKGMDKIADWARDGVYWAVNNGVIGGVSNGDGTFSMDPTGKTWRSAAAKMFTVTMRDVM